MVNITRTICSRYSESLWYEYNYKMGIISELLPFFTLPGFFLQEQEEMKRFFSIHDPYDILCNLIQPTNSLMMMDFTREICILHYEGWQKKQKCSFQHIRSVKNL